MEIASVPYKSILNGSNILKSNFHLNYGKKRVEAALKNKKPFKPLGELTTNVFTGGIFKRVFVEKEDFGLPYISAQHMMNANPLDVAKIISTKYTPRQEDMTLKANQILVSCAGTVGNVKLIGKDLVGVIGSQDIIRVISNDELASYGYLYAYLSTPTAYNYIQSFIYGSVVPRIEPNTLSKIPVPILADELTRRIDRLIKDSVELREKSIKCINEVHNIFDNYITLPDETKQFNKYSSKKINENFHKRLDGGFYINIDNPESELNKPIHNSIPLGKLVKSRMFNAQRGKRNYVKNGGIQFLSTSNIAEKNPLLVDKFLSLKTDGLDTLIVDKDWILISSSGQDILGSCFMVDSNYAKAAVNQHSVRVIIDDKKISPFYIFGFLSNKKVKKYLRAGIYGSAVLTINEDFLKHVLIPILPDKKEIQRVVELTQKHVEFFEEACLKEKEAIDLVEKEIESWQK
jgi:type I restriction enzyme, S subunit